MNKIHKDYIDISQKTNKKNNKITKTFRLL